MTCGTASISASVLKQPGELLIGSRPAKQVADKIAPGTPRLTEDEIIQARAVFREHYSFPPESSDLDAAQSRKVRLLYEVDITLSEQIDAHRRLAELNTEIGNISPPEQWESVASIPDLSARQIDIKTIDTLSALRNNLSRNGELARQEIRRTDRNLNLATKSYEHTEKQRMDFKDQTGPDESINPIVADLETATLASRAAEEKLALCRLQSRIAQAALTLNENKIKRFKPFLANYRLKVMVTPAQVQEQLDALSAKEADLEKSLLVSQEQFAQMMIGAPVSTAPVSANVSPGDTVLRLARSYERDAAHARISLHQMWINHLNIERQFYIHRADFYRNKITRSHRSEVVKELNLEIQQLKSEADLLIDQLEQAGQDASRIDDQFAGNTDISSRLIQTLRDASGEIVGTLRMKALSTESTLSRLENFNDELEGSSVGFSWLEIRAFLGDRVPLAWNSQLFILNDKAFRVSTLFWLVLLVVTGLFAARHISRAAGSLLTSRAKLTPGVSAAYEKLILYLLVVVICIFIFKLFNFSLTSLTVVSGVFALAIGFGSQEVLKNFISGIILLVERPVHEGDLIEIEGQILKVQSIGLRSTQVLGYDNSQKIVPNHLLLGDVITNWTLSDNILRSNIKIGVTYGSPTRKTAEVMRAAACTAEGVLASPEPFALLSDFSDSSLGFTVYFWTKAADRLTTSSEARHRIMEALAAENITISFPQRDVHLDSSNPIRIELNGGLRADSENIDLSELESGSRR